MLAAVRRRKEAAIALDEAGEYEVTVSSSLAEGARHDWSRCLAFVQCEETTRAEGLDGHVHGFLDAAWQLQQAFAAAAEQRQPTAAQLRAEIRAVRRNSAQRTS